MTFLNPLVLIGLIAGAIPIILHLLNLRKLKTVEFSTLKFLKELQKTKIRRLKLKQILLLILRTLLIIFAVLAFARPTIEGSIPGFENFAQTSAVIIIDNSFSMDVSDEWGNRFNQAKNTGSEILKILKEGDEVAVIPMASPGFVKSVGLTKSFSVAMMDLTEMKIQTSKASIENSLRLAASILEDASNINREIFIISDCQRNILAVDIEDSLNLFASKTSIYIVPIGANAKSDIQNLSVDSINVISRIFQSGKPVELELVVKNHSMKNVSGYVMGLIFNKSRVSQRSIDIPAGKSRTTPISSEPSSKGVYVAYIEIENDALEYDNKRYFGFYIPDKPKIILAGKKENTAYISAALGGQSDKSYSDLEITSSEGLAGVDFNQYDIVVCTDGTYRQTDLDRLYQFIINGGSVLLFANSGDNNDIYSQFLNRLGFSVGGTKHFNSAKPANFISVDKMHPVFEGVFKGTTDRTKLVETASIFRAKPATAGQSIIEIPGGSFFAEMRIESGKAFYCAVSPDLNWSDFPMTGLFPTLIYRSTVYLSAGEDLAINVEAGNPLNLILPKKIISGGNFKIIDPNGTEFYKEAAILPTSTVISFEEFRTQGVYSVYTPNNQIVSLISVNSPKSESELTPIPEKELLSQLKSRTGDAANIMYINSSQNVRQDINRVRLGTELWKFFLLAALLCAVAEMLIARATKAELATA